MSGNRVEELEAKVRELEATIGGLTDELVETKERLVAIEAEAEIEPDVLEGRLAVPTSADESTASESEGRTESESETGDEDAEGSSDSVGDDIIVA